MKRRHHFLLSLCAFALLSFAFYLTFIQQEKPEFTPEQIKAASTTPAAFKGETQKAIAATAQAPIAAAHK